MELSVITLFPEMFDSVTHFGITGRAFDNGVVGLKCYNPRDFTSDKHQTVDDRPYGGGPGMVMMVKPLAKAVEKAKQDIVEAGKAKPTVIYMSPQGRPVNQNMIRSAAQLQSLILVAGRYEGVDERFTEEHVDEEWSIGDYVLSGGELPAMVVIDALIRMLPSTLGKDASAEQDSFMNGLLDYPHYTRPEEYEGISVPPILLSGDHGKIDKWRGELALKRTFERRPDLIEQLDLSDEQKAILNKLK